MISLNMITLICIAILAGMAVFQEDISKFSYFCMCAIAACSTLGLILKG